MKHFSIPNKPKLNYLNGIVLAIFAVYAVGRTSHSVFLLFPADPYDMHDIRLIYNTWKQFITHETAAEAMQTITYLPYVWWGMTPIFCWGWPATKIIWGLVNFILAFYACYRLGNLLGLDVFKQCALVILFFSWLSTGLVIGLGNLAMVTLAAVLAAFPFQTRTKSLWLIPAAFKHSLIYPVYLFLLIRQPKKIIVPMAVLFFIVAASMLWAGSSPQNFFTGLKNGQAISKVWMHENTTVSFVPFFEGLLGENALAQVVNWAFWFVLFGMALFRIKDPLILVATLLLLALLPMHHRNYDLIVALPALAIFLKYYSFWFPVAMTLALCGINDHLENAHFYGSAALKLIIPIYYPVLILIVLAVLMTLDHQLNSRKSLNLKIETGF